MFYSVLFLASRRSARHFIKLNLIEMNKMCSSFIAFSTSTDFLTPITSQCFLFPHHSRLLHLLIHQTSKADRFSKQSLDLRRQTQAENTNFMSPSARRRQQFQCLSRKSLQNFGRFFHRA